MGAWSDHGKQFQWLDGGESADLEEKKMREVREEIGDVLIDLVRLADRLGIDLLQAAWDKIAVNL